MTVELLTARKCCCDDDGGGGPGPGDPTDPEPCPQPPCGAFSCTSPVCPSARLVDLSGISLDFDAYWTMRNTQGNNTIEFNIGGLVASKNDFQWVGQFNDLVVATCDPIGRYRYVNENPQNPWPAQFTNPDDYPVCGTLADNATASWMRDPASMPSPDFPATEGSQYLGNWTSAGYEAENSLPIGYPNPYIEGWYSDQMFREIDRVEAYYSVQQLSGCYYILQTVEAYLWFWARGKILGYTGNPDDLVAGCLAGATRVFFRNTRPVYCFSNSAGICYPAPGEYGEGQNGFGVPVGVTGTSFATVTFDGVLAIPNGPTGGSWSPSGLSCDIITVS